LSIIWNATTLFMGPDKTPQLVGPSTNSSTRAQAPASSSNPLDCPDERMIQGGEHARLAFEPRYALGTLGDCQWQELDCYFTSQFRVDGTIDLAHSSAAELREDLVRTDMTASAASNVHVTKLTISPFKRPFQNYAIVRDSPVVNIDPSNNVSIVTVAPGFSGGSCQSCLNNDGPHVAQAGVTVWNPISHWSRGIAERDSLRHKRLRFPQFETVADGLQVMGHLSRRVDGRRVDGRRGDLDLPDSRPFDGSSDCVGNAAQEVPIIE
jgi:hypothetical protein